MIADSYKPEIQQIFSTCPPCELEDNFYEDPHYCPVGSIYSPEMNANAECAQQCADLCAYQSPGCDAYTYIPQRCQLAASGETTAVCPFLPAFCAMYDFDGLEDNVEGQMDCKEFETYGGGFPYGQDVFWENTPLKSGDGVPWCLNCCDNRRMARNFKDTFVMQCDYDTAQMGLTLGYSFNVPVNVEDDLSDIVFRFATRPTITDTETVTSCVLNRHLVSEHVSGYYKRAQNFLIGYNLTIGVKEHRSGLDYWKGVEYCYAEPIVSTRNHWENLRSEDTLKFMEIITITNLPDPLKEQASPEPAWHAWHRRLGSSTMGRKISSSTFFVAFLPVMSLFFLVSLVVTATSRNRSVPRSE